MVHFYEASIITTKDGLHFQVYSNEHPPGYIIAKPKYIPMEKISSAALPCRYLSGRRMNRLDMWTEKSELKKYLDDFKKKYPEYIYHCALHKNWFFAVPLNKIEKVYDPRKGLKELMQMPAGGLDNHLKSVVEFITFVLKSGLKVNDLGVTYSTLVGHYFSDFSDINLVVYGKKSCWKLMKFLEKAEHPLLRWKTDEEWLDYRKHRSRSETFSEEEFLFQMKRKKSEGFFNGKFFLIFCVEEPGETWFRWGEEEYIPIGLVKIRADVTNSHDSMVRPGCYEIANAKIIHPADQLKEVKEIKKVVYHSRDYVMQAYTGEKIEASGLLEKVHPKNGSPYYRLVVGYFDVYTSDRRGKEYIKVVGQK